MSMRQALHSCSTLPRRTSGNPLSVPSRPPRPPPPYPLLCLLATDCWRTPSTSACLPHRMILSSKWLSMAMKRKMTRKGAVGAGVQNWRWTSTRRRKMAKSSRNGKSSLWGRVAEELRGEGKGWCSSARIVQRWVVCQITAANQSLTLQGIPPSKLSRQASVGTQSPLERAHIVGYVETSAGSNARGMSTSY